jgi:carboxylesterase type B
MVYIHGGGWLSGEGSKYQPNYLLDKDVVLVTFNYRLGALGKQLHFVSGCLNNIISVKSSEN